MKRFLIASLLIFVCYFSINAQDVAAPYKRFNTIPPIKVANLDSSKVEMLKNKFTKKTPAVLIFFNTECEHCNLEAERLSKEIDKVKDIQFIFLSIKPLFEIKEFLNRHGLDKYKNITAARDISYMMASYFDIQNVPFHAFFDKNHKLISVERDGVSIDKIAEILK